MTTTLTPSATTTAVLPVHPRRGGWRTGAASALLSTLELRGLNQQVIDGRLPESVGGEFADANALGGPAPRRRGPRIRIGFQPFDENETLAHYYAAALRGAGFRVSVRGSGLRPATVRAMRRKRIDMWPGYGGSLRGYLGARTLQAGLTATIADCLPLAARFTADAAVGLMNHEKRDAAAGGRRPSRFEFNGRLAARTGIQSRCG